MCISKHVSESVVPILERDNQQRCEDTRSRHPDNDVSSRALLSELERKNRELNTINTELARANAAAAELIAEIEEKSRRIEELNQALSLANAHSAEVLAEIAEKNTLLEETNSKLALANARAAELMAELELKNEHIEKLNQKLLEQNREITLLSITDPLTGCYNRHHMNSKLPTEMQRSERYGHPLSVILCDIDHFKQINDTYGHSIGDLVLKEFATCLRESVRSCSDWVVRFGGEEFLIVLTETDHTAAVSVAERIRGLVNQRQIHIGSGTIRITASFGVASCDPGIGTHACLSMEAILEKADRNLYQAKTQGRNTVVGEALSIQEKKGGHVLRLDR